MKKIKMDFETDFWYCKTNLSCMALLDAFFEMDDLATVKNMLCEVMNYSIKCEVIMKEDPSLIFHFYHCMRSFIKACYMLQFKTKKWKLNAPPEYTSKLLQGSLSNEEYRDPFLVFQNAFKEISLSKFQNYLTQSVYFSLGAYNNQPEAEFITPFIHLTKMLDAAQIIRERGMEKIKK